MAEVSSGEVNGQQLARFCSVLPRLRRMHGGPVGAAKRQVIDRALRAARAGEPIDGYLAELGLVLFVGDTAGSAPPQPDRSSRPTAIADAGPHTVPGEHVCPRGVCPRRERRPAGQKLPVCEVFDLALRFEPEC